MWWKLGNYSYVNAETHAGETPSSIFLGVYYEYENISDCVFILWQKEMKNEKLYVPRAFMWKRMKANCFIIFIGAFFPFILLLHDRFEHLRRCV